MDACQRVQIGVVKKGQICPSTNKKFETFRGPDYSGGQK